MKKLIAGILIGAVLATGSFAIAAKIRNINVSKIVGLGIDIQWGNDLAEITDVTLTSKSINIDDTGARAGDSVVRTAFNDLPPNVQAAVSNLIKHQGRALSNEIAEDVEPTVPATMPGRGSRP